MTQHFFELPYFFSESGFEMRLKSNAVNDDQHQPMATTWFTNIRKDERNVRSILNFSQFLVFGLLASK